MARYPARHGAVYMSAGGTDAAAALGGAASWTLDMATDRVDVTAFNDANKRYVQGLENISGTFSAFWDDTDDALYDASQSTDGVQMYLYPSTDVPTKYWYGAAWVDMSVDANVSDAVKLNGSFVANGDWAQK